MGRRLAVVAVSIAAHVWLLRALPEGAMEDRARPGASPMQLEMVEVEPPTDAVTHAASDGLSRLAAAAAPRRAVPSAQPAVATPAIGAAAVSAVDDAREPPAGVLDTAPQSAPAVADFSPRAVALAQVAAASGARDHVARAEPDADTLAQRRGAELSADLAEVVRRSVSRPRELELQRDPDGTCHFAGHSINATILPDGGVQVEPLPARVVPRLGVAEPPERPVTPEDMVAPQQLALGFELRGRAWEAERRWFMDETAALRAELAEGARQRELAHFRARLERELEELWCDAQLSPAARRRALFERWDETSADEIGQLGRDVIADFVRRHLPHGSELAYPEAELAALNARRAQARAFEPYAHVVALDAGVR